MEDCFYIEKRSIELAEGYRVVKASDYRVYLKTSNLLSKTRSKVKKIIEDTGAAYTDQKKKGYADGYEDGKNEIARIITETAIEASVYKEKIEERIIDTIVVVLRNILDEIGDDEVLRQIVCKTLRTNKIQKEITIRVCSPQLKFVRQAVETLQKMAKINGVIEIIADSSLERGRCMVHTEFASVDVGLDVQLKMIKTLLTEHISRFKKR
jgi:type III secretion protein L